MGWSHRSRHFILIMIGVTIVMIVVMIGVSQRHSWFFYKYIFELSHGVSIYELFTVDNNDSNLTEDIVTNCKNTDSRETLRVFSVPERTVFSMDDCTCVWKRTLKSIIISGRVRVKYLRRIPRARGIILRNKISTHNETPSSLLYFPIHSSVFTPYPLPSSTDSQDVDGPVSSPSGVCLKETPRSCSNQKGLLHQDRKRKEELFLFGTLCDAGGGREKEQKSRKDSDDGSDSELVSLFRYGEPGLHAGQKNEWSQDYNLRYRN